ncbi:TPA: PAAR domain-containing protein [Proteus mirabilis]|nr:MULTISPECIES: PAAR domain-containing protein [Proteus]EIM6941539.1 PAAR domain-containing protein [Proteus mirabilis]EIO2234418.1 PAAR domain-containing protein [Proteus mirabilis]EJD6537209.1 PAAR domain-containing protein [Proteus mirabilis]EKU0061672.1 PAAR domain-containing protein [Proteus mirabilis]EKU5732730.1 PAAR domain-containing protein [Proteus mirabilis]
MSKLRPNIFGKAMAINGDKTTTGATCIATIQNVSCHQKMALRVGDPTTICPKCGQAGKIATGENRINNHGKVQAVEGSVVECGCPFGSNVVIASTTHTSARFANVTITPEESFYKNNISQENKSYATPIIDIAEHKYTVTIYTAYPGTPMSDDNGSPRFEGGNSSIRKTSSAGHMWLQIKEFNKYNKIIGDHSYGFAPINTGIKGDGIVTKTDTIHYENPYYNRTIEITKQQYNKIYEFGQMAVNKSETYFNLYYHGITNSCIDFTWKTLRHAGITPNVNLYDSAQLSNINGNIKIFEKQQGKFDGDLKVIDNIPHIKSITPPFPNSDLNTEKYNKIPERDLLQWSLSKNNDENGDKNIDLVKR